MTEAGLDDGVIFKINEMPCILLGRLKFIIFDLAASVFGIVTMLPWSSSKFISHQLISITFPSVPSMETVSPGW